MIKLLFLLLICGFLSAEEFDIQPLNNNDFEIRETYTNKIVDNISKLSAEKAYNFIIELYKIYKVTEDEEVKVRLNRIAREIFYKKAKYHVPELLVLYGNMGFDVCSLINYKDVNYIGSIVSKVEFSGPADDKLRKFDVIVNMNGVVGKNLIYCDELMGFVKPDTVMKFEVLRFNDSIIKSFEDGQLGMVVVDRDTRDVVIGLLDKPENYCKITIECKTGWVDEKFLGYSTLINWRLDWYWRHFSLIYERGRDKINLWSDEYGK